MSHPDISKHFTSLDLLLTQVSIAMGKTLSQGFNGVFHFPPANWEEDSSATFVKGFGNIARRVLFRYEISVAVCHIEFSWGTAGSIVAALVEDSTPRCIKTPRVTESFTPSCLTSKMETIIFL